MPVGHFGPNVPGRNDMAGNGWEWCSEFGGPYGNEEQVNPYKVAGPQSRCPGWALGWRCPGAKCLGPHGMDLE